MYLMVVDERNIEGQNLEKVYAKAYSLENGNITQHFKSAL